MWANVASFVNVGAAVAAFALLFLTLRATQDSLTAAQKAVTEAHEQTVQSHRQADIAQKGLVAATRAQLKLTTMTSGSADRPSSGIVARFSFKPVYKNFGQAPAQSIQFVPHIFVIGTGPSPTKTCENDKRLSRGLSLEIVFPQDVGGKSWIDAQVSLQELEAEAAAVQSDQPSATIYLGVIGCLIYKSTTGDDTYATGFVGDLHSANKNHFRPRKYIPLYNSLVENAHPAKVGMEIRTMSSWAD